MRRGEREVEGDIAGQTIAFIYTLVKPNKRAQTCCLAIAGRRSRQSISAVNSRQLPVPNMKEKVNP